VLKGRRTEGMMLVGSRYYTGVCLGAVVGAASKGRRTEGLMLVGSRCYARVCLGALVGAVMHTAGHTFHS
jgi:uncharacterized membrane protein